MDSTISLLLSAAATIVSGVAVYIIKKHLSKKDETDKQLREDTERENVLILRSINAIGKLTLANSIALRDGKANGEMSSALVRDVCSHSLTLLSFSMTKIHRLFPLHTLAKYITTRRTCLAM